MDALILIVAVALSFGGGVLATLRTQIGYRQRWKAALKVIDRTDLDQLVDGQHDDSTKPPDATPGIERIGSPPSGKAVKKASKAEASFDIMALPSAARARIEITRIEEGFPPRDNLVGMDPKDAEKVIIARIEEGWDH